MTTPVINTKELTTYRRLSLEEVYNKITITNLELSMKKFLLGKLKFRFNQFNRIAGSMLNEWGGANLTTKGGASFNRSLLCTYDEERGYRPLRSTHTRQTNGHKITDTTLTGSQ